jgi:catechol 2,3-dioxygenase-like lactoylglutathione lyase family enzyme
VRVTGLHHTGLVVSDLDRSLGFYRDLLGIPVRELVEDVSPEVVSAAGWKDQRARIADLDLGEGRVLELIERTGGTGAASGSIHIALEVDDVREAWRRVTAAGYATRSEPVTLHDAGPYWSGATIVYVSDPDGTAIELVEPVVPLAARRAGEPVARIR